MAPRAHRRALSERAQFVVALSVIVVIGLVVYVPHVVHGGLAADDWVDASRFYFHHGSGFGAAVAAHADPSRTVWSVINTLDWWLMGIHPVPQLMQTLVASLVEAGLILAVARRLGMPLLAGATLALLVLLWPAADSSRLWATGAQQTIAVVLLLAGFLVALIGLDRHGPWSVVLHCLAVVLYVASMLDYELTAPVILLAGFVYVHQVGWRRGGWRWALDAIAVVTTLLHRDLTTHKHSFGVSADLDHARAVGDQALTLAAHSVLPVGGVPRAAVLIGIGGVVGVGLVLAVSGPPSQRQRARRNVGYLAAGAAVVVAGYLMIVPADPGYQPDSAGVGNRINAVAALGFALIVVALCRMVGQVAARVTGGSGRRVAGVSTALALLIIAMSASVVVTDASHWDRASVEQQETLAVIRHLVPSPSATTTVFTFGRSGYTAPSVPIFGGGGNGDLVGAVRVMWKNGSVRGFPVLDQMHFVCSPHSVRLLDTGSSSTTLYGRADFINILTSNVVVPRDRHECLAVTAAFPYASVNESND
jgi:hypothetical protein